MKTTFTDGSTLMTGDDMTRALEALWNHRGNYELDCSFCRHEDNEETYDKFCGGCSISDRDLSCSCHINPPCGKCVNSAFDVSPFLIDYEHIKTGGKDGKRRWECFKGDKETYDKLKVIEATGRLKMTAETLSTGEIAMYIDNDDEAGEDDCIEICQKKDFRETMKKMIMSWEQSNV